MTTSTFTTTHVRVQSEKKFGEVQSDFEEQLGKFDPAVSQALGDDAERADDARARIEAMAGHSGFMLFGTTDHGSLLTLAGGQRKAVQYVLGNPLIAIEMTRHNLAAGLLRPAAGADLRGRPWENVSWSTTNLRRCWGSSTTIGSPRSPACWTGSWRT